MCNLFIIVSLEDRYKQNSESSNCFAGVLVLFLYIYIKGSVSLHLHKRIYILLHFYRS